MISRGHIAYLSTKKEYVAFLKQQQSLAKDPSKIKVVKTGLSDLNKAVALIKEQGKLDSFWLVQYLRHKKVTYFAYYNYESKKAYTKEEALAALDNNFNDFLKSRAN